MHRPFRRWLPLLVPPLVACCDHGTAYPSVDPPPSGPFSTALPRRLTFFEGDDHTPSVAGTVIAFSRQSADEPSAYLPTGRETCLVTLPLEGGTLLRTLCPGRLLPATDTLVDTWLEPALSPDGRRIAFVWQRGLRISALGYLDTYLMVTDPDRPADTTGFRQYVRYVEPGPGNPRRADLATRITWIGPDRLRFLATLERIFKVKGGGASRVTDTLLVPLALMEADLPAGTMSVVPGGDSVIAYATAPGGGIWVALATSPDTLRLLDPASGARPAIGAFSGGVSDLIAVDGAPVAIIGDSLIERVDLTTGARLDIGGFAGPVHRIAPAGGRRFVADIEQARVLFGAPTDLWLYELP